MKLVKDFVETGIVYYWVDETAEPISPHLASLALAEEWRNKHVFSQFEGEERRCSIYDRRSNQQKRDQMAKGRTASRLNPYGRRKTDPPAEVDIDLCSEKIKAFR